MTVWNFSAVEALAWFKEGVGTMKLPYVMPSLYMLRHGGASHDAWAQTRSIEMIKKRGRWMSDRSLRRYEKSQRTQQLTAMLTPSVLQFATAIDSDLAAYVLQLRKPPAIPAEASPPR